MGRQWYLFFIWRLGRIYNWMALDIYYFNSAVICCILLIKHTPETKAETTGSEVKNLTLLD